MSAQIGYVFVVLAVVFLVVALLGGGGFGPRSIP